MYVEKERDVMHFLEVKTRAGGLFYFVTKTRKSISSQPTRLHCVAECCYVLFVNKYIALRQAISYIFRVGL